jgi:hypothetical protein
MLYAIHVTACKKVYSLAFIIVTQQQQQQQQ